MLHYGKRNPGGLTAANPGDTLYIPLNFYNDSGASISIGASLAAGDIEVFKNGSVTQRATDSGYAVLGDTGNFDNRTGFKGISISLFNTADDPTFYAVGSTYWVGIDSVTVDARTVRFWAGVFEIGEPRANLVQIAGDTGAANQLKNAFANGFNDTGVNDRLAKILADTDTGIQSSVNVTGFSDTGVNNRLAVIAADTDTGIQSSVRVTAISDTGVNQRLGAVQTKTDSLTFTTAGQVDANVQSVNDIAVSGAGTAGDPWGP